MKKYIKKHKKLVIILVIICFLIILFPVMLNYWLFDWRAKGTNGDIASWISFFATFYGAIIGGVISGILTLIGVRYTLLKQERQDIIKAYPIKRKLGDDVSKIVTDTWRNTNRCINKDRDYNKLKKYLNDILAIMDSLLEKSSKVSDEVYEEIRSNFLVNVKDFSYMLGTAQFTDNDLEERLNYYLAELLKNVHVICDVNEKITNEYKKIKKGL
ncbi:hypothetical protein JMM81_12415 [Bacillus sp. V3B]|uniref:hypothetical protein n=1 Tax=Bacillus sp. V3B TaxID=2804915 RepID=UPI00210D2F76|nr:hypothetical protein [Bacillus sp. V3B]MCQ6275759.1 hypothetical protein [Bacillus sp. V3B]